ncbi:hypothetical protein E4U21_002366 [Claviceps maximensis]|nr:hypothetical protein E4U21_002366 [Claviceps maximensis]
MTPYNTILAVVLCALVGVGAVPATLVQPITIATDSGLLTGTYMHTGVRAVARSESDASTTAVARFLGIRFGKPPMRFAPAEPAAPWNSSTSTPYDASAYGPTCLQQFNYPDDARNRTIRWFNTPSFPGTESEDCLFLNVFAPASTSAPPAQPLRAVMVWFYGGAFKIGSGALPAYDGTEFAARQDVLVVTFNYRVGVFGFPGAPQIATQEQNLGLLDQRLALDWVQRNIAAFGGDPRRVTIFGESAGAGSVDALVTLPPAADAPPPFAAAIMQSGQGTAGVPDPRFTSRNSWRRLARALGCSEDNDQGLLCMRAAPATQLRDAAEHKSLSFFPIHDGGATWADHPRRDRQAGRIARVPILIGSNANEGGPMVYGTLDLRAFLGSIFPPDSPLGFVNTLLTGSSADGSPGLLDTKGQTARIVTEYSFQCSAALVAAESRAVGIPAWRYYYNASFPNTDIYPGSGAFHSAEVTTLFGTFPSAGATPFQRKLHLDMQSAWAAFAKNPNQGPGWDSAPNTIAVLGGGATPGADDEGRETISMVSPQAIDRRCSLYNVPYGLTT